MGEVYRADDLKLGQSVALKFLPREVEMDGARQARFLNEVKIARQISHANVCRVYDVADVDGRQFLSMEYVDGEDLAGLVRRIGHLPKDKAVQIARQLCAGLAAAHEQGVLHRDLKPANVMIDGRGRAKITDFGLAVLGEDREHGAGTLAYMAPEQLAGEAATVKSDLYALGLVLYELFTGHRPFSASSVQELARLQRESTPTNPSTHIEGFDPAVERVILRCLRSDPNERPPSALTVAAALPGGDPLAAALAAGETPSPEMIAAAGAEGALSPAKAWTLLGATLLLVAAVFGFARFTMDQNLAPFPKSPDALEDRARELIRSFGYTTEPADSASWWERQRDYLDYRAKYEPSTEWWPSLSRSAPHPWRFWYRESPRILVPENPYSDTTPIRPTDPPMEVSGMVSIAMDARGNLERLRVVPRQVEELSGPATPPDWTPFFAAAGLDYARFTPTAPKWTPEEPFDARADWKESVASQSVAPIHVAAASWHGKPVWFAVLYPWSVPERDIDSSGSTALANFAVVTYIGGSWIAGVILARRNLRLGRGDRRGALRVAAFVFVTGVLSWLFGWHHVPQLATEFFQLINALAFSVFFAVYVWLAYIAIEPILRRRSPELLFSWSRLLAGRFRDPLVGRDLLTAILGSAALAILLQVPVILPNWIPLSGMTPQPPSRSLMTGAASSISRIFGLVYQGPLDALGFMTLFAFGLVVLRRRWGAAALLGLIITLAGAGSAGENYALLLPAAIVGAAAFVFIAMRSGLLAVAVILVVTPLLVATPWTLEVSRWYAGRGLVVAAGILVLTIWAFWTSLGGRRALGPIGLQDV
jgi:serine/threonine-protein kinase